MVIIPAIMGEAELSLFTPEDFKVFKKLLNAPLCKYLKEYMESADANPDVVARLKEEVGPIVESYTLQYEFVPDGTVEMVNTLIPQNIVKSDGTLNTLIERLSKLKDREHLLVATIPARNSKDYKDFLVIVNSVLLKQSQLGITPTFPDVMKRLKANSYVFYTQHEKPQATGLGALIRQRNKWLISLRGAQYTKYCDENNISIEKRGFF